MCVDGRLDTVRFRSVARADNLVTVPLIFEKRLLWILVLVGLLLRLGWGIGRASDETSLEALPDQVEYLHLGQNLLWHGTLFFDDPRFQQAVFAYRMPGYPVLIAICGGQPRAVRVVQAILGASNVLAVYWLAGWVLPAEFALLAALLVAVNPFLIYFSGLILSETLCTSMVLWGTVLCMGVRIRIKRWLTLPVNLWRGLTLRGDFLGRAATPSPKPGRAKILARIFGPVLLAASVMVRPSGLFLPLLLPIAVWITWRGNESFFVDEHSSGSLGRSRAWLVAGPVIGVVTLAVLLGLWSWRNQSVLGVPVWGTTNEGITLYDGFNPRATGGSDQRFVQQMPYLQELNEIHRSAYLGSLATKYMQHHRSRVYTLALAKLARTYSPVPLSREFGRPLYRAIAATYSVPVYLLVICALIFRCIDWRWKLLLLVVPVYFGIVHALSVGSLRYRMPAEPFLAILAAAGAWSIVRASHPRPAVQMASEI